MKMNVTLKSNANSSRRTRNRLREHGPTFRAERSGSGVPGFGLCWLLHSEDGWFGWLPRDEFDWAHTDTRPRGEWKTVVPWLSRSPVPQDDPDFRNMMPTSRETYYDGGGWPGDGSGMDDLADYNAMEGCDY